MQLQTPHLRSFYDIVGRVQLQTPHLRKFLQFYSCLLSGHCHHTESGWPTIVQVVPEAHQDRPQKTPESLLLVQYLR